MTHSVFKPGLEATMTIEGKIQPFIVRHHDGPPESQLNFMHAIRSAPMNF